MRLHKFQWISDTFKHYTTLRLHLFNFIQSSNICMDMCIPGYISSNTCSNTCQIKDLFMNMTKNAQVGPHQYVLCTQNFVYKITW